LGLVLYTSLEVTAHLDHILFGNMLGVGAGDLVTSGLISAVVTLAILAKWKDLMLHSFDPAQAKASGLPVNLIHYGLLTALSLTIVATLSAVGLILAIGLLIAPGAIAFLVARSFQAMLVVAVVVNLFSMLAGTYLSFFIDSAPAPTIVLVLTIFFIAAFANRLRVTRAAGRA
ncbi:MAG: iron chelate uptake ABC transporter family permease subunit, partial [Pseudomonadota bacterium]